MTKDVSKSHKSSKATPRPWRVRLVEKYDNYSRWTIDPCVCDVFYQTGEGDANAALIVAAVNAYDKARELAELTFTGHTRPELPRWIHERKIELAREVLRIMGEDK